MRRALAVVVLAGVASCADPAPTVTITADGAAWLAVEADGVWTRHEASPVTFVAHGRYQAVVVCRADVGQGWSVVAYAEDVPTVTYPCAAAEPEVGERVTVGFASGVDVGVNFAGRSLIIPRDASLDVPRGTYDVIARAVQPFNDPRPPRVEILRDVAVMDPREVALNVDRVGVDTVPAGLTVDGAVPSYASVGTWTAGGSWFAHSAFYRQPWVLPARVLRPSDTTEATIERDGGWARFPYVGPVDRPVPVELVDATLRWDPLPTAAVDTVGDWRWISLWVGDLEFRKWRVWAEPALVADEGEVRVEAPAVEGWDPAWLPDPDRERWWEVRWHRELADGSSEGRHAGTTFLSY